MRANNPSFLMIVVATLLSSISLLSGCTAKPSRHEAKAEKLKAAEPGDLQAAMDKLDESIAKPSAPFHVSLEKSQSDGFSYQCEADISSNGILGKQLNVAPATKVGNDVFPAKNTSRELKGTPAGSPEWGYVRGSLSMTFLNGHIKDAQEGVKYVRDEQTGGYDTRRYDFDLTNVDATIKRALSLGNAMPGARQTKDYNVKGSAWIAKADGRMVKYQFENIWVFADGSNYTTHYEGTVTKQ
jgi:outer membrane murein-binding lipoprotein Lpp